MFELSPEAQLLERLAAVDDSTPLEPTGRSAGPWTEFRESGDTTTHTFWARLAESVPAGYDYVEWTEDSAPGEADLDRLIQD